MYYTVSHCADKHKLLVDYIWCSVDGWPPDEPSMHRGKRNRVES